MYVGR